MLLMAAVWRKNGVLELILLYRFGRNLCTDKTYMIKFVIVIFLG
jgi:hypothetical protein